MTFTKVVFELTSNWFRKWFSRKWECLVVTSNSVKLKSISSWPNLRAKTMEMIFRFYFHFKLLPALENRRERERERERKRGRKKESIATSPSADIIGCCGSANRDRDWRFDLRLMRRSSRDRRIARTRRSWSKLRAKRRPLRSRSRRSFDRILWFFSWFCLCFEK